MLADLRDHLHPFVKVVAPVFVEDKKAIDVRGLAGSSHVSFVHQHDLCARISGLDRRKAASDTSADYKHISLYNSIICHVVFCFNK